jgi:histidyl-tRNA synthetase
MGLDRVLLAMEDEQVPLPPEHAPACFVVVVGGGAAESRRLVEELRDAGVAAAASFEERPLKAQLRMADRVGARLVAIVGERELAEEAVTLRRLVDGVQKSVPRDAVVEWVARLRDEVA